ncbi:MAG: helix-turn-helix domain-containing protein [Dehalococcoidia bacterium]|nr:helix-turn-helix domain-containing protein [Dehalococcoidia bacterium]
MTDALNNHQFTDLAADLLTVPETARILRISRNLAYELVARNEIPAIRLGRVIRVSRYSLNEWIASQAAQRAEQGTLSSPHG